MNESQALGLLASVAGFYTSGVVNDQDLLMLCCTRQGCGWSTVLRDGVALTEQVAVAVAHVEAAHRLGEAS